MSIHQIIDMVPVRDSLVSAAGSMLVTAPCFRSAACGIGGVDPDGMFVDVIAVHVVQMAVMQIVEMTIMADCCVTAIGAMLVGMVWMVLLRAIGHAVRSFGLRSSRPAGLVR